jgi:hypothetical protein
MIVVQLRLCRDVEGEGVCVELLVEVVEAAEEDAARLKLG